MRLFGSLQDITEQKRAEEALKEITQRLKLAVSSAKLGIWDWDLTSNKMVWDDRMLELYGLTRETFPGGIEAWQNGLHLEDRDKTIEECQAALRGEKEWDTDFRVLHPDGTIKHIKANGMVIRDSAGTPVRMLGINFDITERKLAEKALQESNELLTLFVRHSPVYCYIKEVNSTRSVVLCNDNDEKLATAMGVKGFLMKPVAIGDLAEMVRKVLDEVTN